MGFVSLAQRPALYFSNPQLCIFFSLKYYCFQHIFILRIAMRVKHSQSMFVYERITQNVQYDRHRLLILPANGVDALCSCRILISMLASDSIPYQVQPVTSYDDLAFRIQDFTTPEQPTSVILLNCGAAIDIRSFLDMDSPERKELYVYVFDSHRPFHLTNIDPDNKHVRVMMNAEDEEIEFPPNVTTEDLAFLESLESGEGIDEEELQRNIAMLPWSDDEEDGGDEGESEGEYEGEGEGEGGPRDDKEDEDDQDNEDDIDENERDIEATDSTAVEGPGGVFSSRKNQGGKAGRSFSVAGNTISSTYDSDENNNNEDKNVDEEDERKRQRKKRPTLGNGNMASFHQSMIREPKRIRTALSLSSRRTPREKTNALLERREVVLERIYAEKEDRKSEILERVENLTTYYRVTYISQSVAFVLFSMTCSLRRHNNDGLWCAMVATTHNYTNELIDAESYEQLRIDLAGVIYEFEQNVTAIGGAGIIGGLGLGGQEAGTSSRLVRGAIRESTEFCFPLLRFWNLLDAVRHSRVAASALRVWTERGESELKRLLVKMAISLRDAMKPFELLPETVRTALARNLKIVGPTFGLLRTSCESFVRKHTTTVEISASDFALVLEVLSERPFEQSTIPSQTHTSNDDHTSNLDTNSSSKPYRLTEKDSAFGVLEDNKEENPEDIFISNACDGFWTALDSLEFGNVKYVLDGVNLSKQLQMAVVRQGVAMLKKKEIDTSAVLHTAIIDSSPDQKLFTNPSALTRLGTFLLDLISLRKASRPLVLGIYIERTNSYLVVGLSGLNRAHSRVGHNAFGRLFREAASNVATTAKHDKFDSYFITVEKEHMTRFLKQLVITLAKSGNTLLRTI